MRIEGSHIESIARRRVHQGEGVNAQYARLNAARDKRLRRQQRNQRNMLTGGTSVPFIGGK